MKSASTHNYIDNKRTIDVCLNIIFHIYRNHKQELTSFRAWFVARYIIDISGTGYAVTEDVCRAVNMKSEHLLRKCKKSCLFSGGTSDRLYYKSLIKLLREHKLPHKLCIRGEKLTKVFMKQFREKKTFISYITKCYVERDLDPRWKKRITRGRISYQAVADYFKISRKTAITNIKRSIPKRYKNRRRYYHIKFNYKKQLGNWILNNMKTIIDGRRVEDNPNSYQVEWKNGSYILVQDLPNIYKFTGVFLESRRIKGQCFK